MKLFTELDIDNYNVRILDKSLVKILATPRVFISFKYSKRRKVIFYNLQAKVDKKSKDLLDGTAIKDSDGEHTFYIGQFPKGTELEIQFGVIGFTTVPKAVALIVQTNPNNGYQVDPKTPGDTKKIGRDEKWEGKFKYTVE